MKEIEILKIQNHPELKTRAAEWFHEKWGIPLKTYLESIDECLNSFSPIPRWYLAMENERIVGGLGVIENDFHERKDLSPNVCSVYVEPEYRRRGIVGKMLEFVCTDMKNAGIDTLYLITDHNSFYERYGWEFLCMAKCCGEEGFSRIYIHNEKSVLKNN